MATMIKVEELMTIEERREICQESRRVEDYRLVRSRCGQVCWSICRHANCYGCYFKTHAVADLMTNDIKGETVEAIGYWSQSLFWKQA
eukprot:11920435-Heterocapsa_arctica.AAC.1